MIALDRGTKVFALFVLCAVTVIVSPAQSFKTLVNFNGTDGEHPFAPLLQGFDGNLYGTTAGYPTSNGGTVFKTTPNGALTTLHSFSGPDGFEPYGGLIQAADGNFYGTTYIGGATGNGTVFRITPGGQMTVLHNFCQTDCSDGAKPIPGLTLGADGEFYGTTSGGGSSGMGTVFRMTPNGAITTLHSFAGSDGADPEGGLIQTPDGSFYGTTYNGGNDNSLCLSFNAVGCGTVFRIDPDGTFTTLYLFCSQTYCADGSNPVATLTQGSDGDLYGTASTGGITYYCQTGCGTIFKIVPQGKLTTLYTFCSQSGCTDGMLPTGSLAQATDGNFYGTTVGGGYGVNCSFYGEGCGTVFRVTRTGKLTTLVLFGSDAGGGAPWSGLLQDTNGILYGTSMSGTGSSGLGTVFGLSVGLRPFIETQPTFGKVAVEVMILGTNLTGTTSVTFNGTTAQFTVISSSEIKTTVPAGATTGKIKVVTPQGTLVSNADFRVLP